MNTTTILNILSMSYPAYDNLRHQYFFRWCQMLSKKTTLPLKMLSCHDGLMNFFNDEWLCLVEKKILNEQKQYIKAGVMQKEDLLWWIELVAEQLMCITPNPLIKMIKKELKIKEKQML